MASGLHLDHVDCYGSGMAIKMLYCILCTRRLASDPLLSGVSHVVVDEVHERSLQVWGPHPGVWDGARERHVWLTPTCCQLEHIEQMEQHARVCRSQRCLPHEMMRCPGDVLTSLLQRGKRDKPAQDHQMALWAPS
jgi:hypothetical protein